MVLADHIAVDIGALVTDHAAATARPRSAMVGGHSSAIASIGCEASTLPGLLLRSRFLVMTYQATIERATFASAVVSR